jgi:hypothetical protein
MSPPDPPKIRFKNAWLQNMIETVVVSFQSSETRQWFQVFLVDPIVSYIMERCLPYIVITAVVIASLFVFVIGTFFLVFRNRNVACPHCVH